ncbi:hypothetical protein ACFOEP_12980 [Microbacterium amylolyticum]|uniref:hypothetical protein n=1 Tax=Microbacterium amylolyticum TaxID=936337 RepID=UPI0036069AC3
MALIWAHLGASSRVREALYAVFDPTFYSGAVLIVTGIIWFWGARLIRAHRTRTRIQRLERILTERAIALPATEDDHAYTVYALLIRITDATVLQKVHLTEEERTTVKESEEWIETILPQLVGASS